MKISEGEVLLGRFGTAVRIEAEFESTDPPDWKTTLDTWFVTAPGQAAFWDKFLLQVIHLRDIPGVPSATINVPGATHEIFLAALNPELGPVPTDNETWQRLTPMNYVGQFEVAEDDHARLLTKMCAQAMLDGILWAEPPLSGQVEPWRSVLIKSSAHFRGEPHAP